MEISHCVCEIAKLCGLSSAVYIETADKYLQYLVVAEFVLALCWLLCFVGEIQKQEKRPPLAERAELGGVPESFRLDRKQIL